MVLSNIVFPSCSVAQARNWCEAIASLGENKYDLVLVDLFMPGNADWKVELPKLVQTAGSSPVCVISSSSSRSTIDSVFELGAKGYIHKSFSSDMVNDALHKMMDGKVFFPSIAALNQSSKSMPGKKRLLTIRQFEILSLVAEGKSNQQISDLLDLQESTVKRHVYNICKILNTRNRSEAVHVARQLGILDNP